VFAIAVPALLGWYAALAVTFRRRVVDRLVALAPRQPRRAAEPATR
jgi:cation-transporting P-type ATPase E